MTGCPVHIEVRTNPEYQYDVVLSTINNNFECINSQLSGITTGTSFINGLNTYVSSTTGSTTYNVSGLSIDNIYVSGTSIFNSITATTVYANNTVLTGDTVDGGFF